MKYSLFLRYYKSCLPPSSSMPSSGDISLLCCRLSEPTRRKSCASCHGQSRRKHPSSIHSFKKIRLRGAITAGFPSPAEEELGDIMNLEEFLIRNKEATYILKVTGDSMIEAGLLPGDLVLVERRADAKDGDIVVAQVDHGWTMKYFRKRGRQIYLEPANKKYRPIYPTEELHIAAVVIAAIRKY